jgi:hypothetical protein
MTRLSTASTLIATRAEVAFGILLGFARAKPRRSRKKIFVPGCRSFSRFRRAVDVCIGFASDSHCVA